MKILVTGGAGYIGSHTCVELLAAGHDVVVADNFYNSKPSVLQRIGEISGKTLDFYHADVCDKSSLHKIFSEMHVDAVIHFAGLKAVGESVMEPLRYYQNNVAGTLALCEIMEKFGVRRLVFSSSATVYGDPVVVPISESATLAPTNPYGRSKLMVEMMLRDLHAANAGWNIALLRYFNPVGAHSSGLIGESPNGTPNNLLPYIGLVAAGKLPELLVFGSDYNTEDGTGVRDYIHVMDLAAGHIKALGKLSSNPGVVTYNLGTGRGFSVLEMVNAFEEASGRKIPYRIVDRRPGDIASCFADVALANSELKWRAERSLLEICSDAWRWQLSSSNLN